MKNILPIQFIMTANKKRKDNRELEVYLYTKNKKKQLKVLTIYFKMKRIYNLYVKNRKDLRSKTLKVADNRPYMKINNNLLR